MPFTSVSHSAHIVVDNAPTSTSGNLISSGAMHTSLAAKESTLSFVNGNNIAIGGSGAPASISKTGNVVTFLPRSNCYR